MEFPQGTKKVSNRDKKVAEEIRREVSQILHFEMSDPRVMGASVTTVRMTPDLKLARVYFALPGAEERASEAEAALKKSAAYVRRLLAGRILMKYLPQIEFFYDETLELENKMKAIFSQLPESPDSLED